MPDFGQKVLVRGTDPFGNKETFDDFVGVYLGESTKRDGYCNVEQDGTLWTVHPSQVSLYDEEQMYLDWVNNFLTVEKFAEHYGISETFARQLIARNQQK